MNTKRPDVAFEFVRLVFPYFGTRIIGSTSLSVCKVLFKKFGDVKVSYFVDPSWDEDVSAFEISMNDVSIMEDANAVENLPHHRPNFLLLDPSHGPFLFFDQFLAELRITSRSPPSANSITMQRVLDFESKKASLYLIMKSELIDANSLTSLSAFCFSFSLRLLILTFIRAHLLFWGHRRFHRKSV